MMGASPRSAWRRRKSVTGIIEKLIGGGGTSSSSTSATASTVVSSQQQQQGTGNNHFMAAAFGGGVKKPSWAAAMIRGATSAAEPAATRGVLQRSPSASANKQLLKASGGAELPLLTKSVVTQMAVGALWKLI
jgi:hypothetical protein